MEPEVQFLNKITMRARFWMCSQSLVVRAWRKQWIIYVLVYSTHTHNLIAITSNIELKGHSSIIKWIEIDQCLSMCNSYRKSVLKEYETIQHGIGMPDLYLALCLALAWIIIVSVLIKGVQSSGKASYFLGM